MEEWWDGLSQYGFQARGVKEWWDERDPSRPPNRLPRWRSSSSGFAEAERTVRARKEEVEMVVLREGMAEGGEGWGLLDGKGRGLGAK
jgi:hypothetical protein